jgi:hypothetical protein
MSIYAKWIISNIYLELYELDVLFRNLITGVNCNVSRIYDLEVLSRSPSPRCNLTLKNS